MAEGIVLNLVTSILGTLASQPLTEFARSGGIKYELQLLENSVSTIRALLFDAEEKYHKSRAVAVWLQQLKDAFLDTEDLLDEISTAALLHQQKSNAVSKFFSSSNPIFLLKFMANRIRKTREQIDKIASESQLLHLVDRPMIDRREVRRRDLTHSFVASEDIIGRDDVRSEIVNFLINSDFSILPIVGIGGLGKTALAQCVFNDDTVSDHFEVKFWACVSDIFDLRSIMRQIIAGGSNNEVGNLEMEQLQTQLRRKLDGKKFLLILDDLWTENREEWLSLKRLLMGGAKGSKILITTRSLMVAKIAGTVQEPYVLGSLSEQKSWSLFVQLAFQQGKEANDSELISIGKEILGKCKGVPLAIRTLGGLLFNKDTKAEWLSIRDKQLQDLTQTENDIIPILKLSYDNLPSHLKECFVICSLFPKDCVMEKNNLVHLWMAHGFITSRNSNEDLEGIGEECFMDLVRRSFFQDLMRDEVGNVKSCKMHDLLHDVAKFVAGHESIAFDGNNKSLRDISERTLHLSCHLTSDLAQFFTVLSNAKKLRTFILAGESWSTPLINTQPLCHDLISRVRRLRHLDLPNAGIKALPDSIGKLKHLRQLDLSRNAITKLPRSIVKLVNLEVLKLRRCGWLKELPRGIQKMASLRCLDIQYCFALTYTPAGIGELTSLSTLPIFVLRGKASNCCARLGELGGLNNLRGSLMIRNIASSKSTSMECSRANLQRKHLLDSLLLSFDDGNGRRNPINDEAQLEELQPHSNLSDLTILNYQGRNLPIWMRDTCLPSLVQMSLYGCDNVVHLPPLHHFLHLKSLNLELLPMLKYFGNAVEDEISHSSFPCLTRLLIRECPKLISVPSAPRLEDLDVRSSNELLVQKPLHLHNLKFLYIAEIESLQSFSEAWFGELISLETMTIWQLPRLRALPRGTQHLAKLEQLEVHKCYELDLSVDEDGNPMQLHDLKSLRVVKLIDLPRLVSAPVWLLHLENLQCLCIANCENLAALPEWLGELKSLRRLEIIDCPKLVSVPEGIMRLKSLESLNIVNCLQLNEACKRESGQDWHKIAHVPNFSEDL